jgi:hypothetical protein
VTPLFWAKMMMIVVLMAMTAVLTVQVRAHAPSWDLAASRPSGARVFAVVSTVLWVAVIVCGRFIGYLWSFYV